MCLMDQKDSEATEDESKYNIQIYIIHVFEALQSLNKHELCWDSDMGFFFLLSLTLWSGTNHHNPSEEQERGVKCIVLRRRR